MKIVGVGCGPGMLTEEAIRVIASAPSVYGSDRAIELAREYIPKRCDVRSIDDFKNLSHLPEDAVILSTGDPMLAGLGYTVYVEHDGKSGADLYRIRQATIDLILLDITMPELAAEMAGLGVKIAPASLSRWLLRHGYRYKKNAAGVGTRSPRHKGGA